MLILVTSAGAALGGLAVVPADAASVTSAVFTGGGGTVSVGGTLYAHASADPMADLVRAQRLAVAVAEAKGYDPDRPRNLTRSVILSSPGA